MPAFIAARARLFLTHPRIGDDPEIMISELEIIFRRHPIPVQVGVMRLLAVFFEHLGRIAPRAAVDPVGLRASAPTPLRSIITPPPAAIIVIITIIVVQG